MERLRRVALYGGSFDPVHLGHLAVARNLVSLFALDEVMFVPAHVAPHKRDRRVSPPFDRYAMLALATQDEPGLRVRRDELESPERPYTVETLAHFAAALGPGVRLFFVMGADSWEEITTWREWERVLTMSDHLVVTRPGYGLDAGHVTDDIRGRITDLRGASPAEAEAALAGEAPRIFLTDAASVDAASTDVRRAVGEGEGGRLGELVSPPVAEYIRKYGLYRKPDANETGRTDAGNK